MRNKAEHYWLYWDECEHRTAVAINPVPGGKHVITTTKRRRLKPKNENGRNQKVEEGESCAKMEKTKGG